METETRTLRILHGAGRAYDIAAEDVRDASGSTTLEALQEIVREQIRDPDLLKTLQDERLVIQAFSDAHDASERIVPPGESFSELVGLLERENLEMAVSVAHEGGA